MAWADIVGFEPEHGTEPSDGIGWFSYSDGSRRFGTHPGLASSLLAPQASNQLGGVPQGETQPVAQGPKGATPAVHMGVPASVALQPPTLSAPKRVGGLVQSGAQLSGAPRSAEDMRAQAEQIDLTAGEQNAALTGAAIGQMRARRAIEDEINAQSEERTRNAEAAAKRESELATEADRRVTAALAEDVGRIDPRRAIKNMSTGQTIAGAIGIMLSGMFGKKGDNRALEIVERAINDDIQSQADELAAGRASRGNRIQYWSQKLGSAERGKEAARVEGLEAARMRIAALEAGAGNAEVKGQLQVAAATLQARAAEAKQLIVDAERERLKVAYAPPVLEQPQITLPPVPAGETSVLRQPGQVQEAYAARMAQLPIKERDQVMGGVKADMAHVAELERATQELAQIYGAGEGYGAVGMYRPDWTTTEKDRRAKQLWAVIETQTRAGWKSEPNGAATQTRLSQIQIPTRDSDVPGAIERLKAATVDARRLIEAGHAPEAIAYYYSQAPKPIAKPITGKVGTK